MNARALACICLALASFTASAQTEEHWTFALTPYIWLPNVNGTLKYSPPPNNEARNPPLLGGV